MVSALAVKAGLRKRAWQPFDTITLIRPVSSSRLMNMVPPAVAGRWRCDTVPACTLTLPTG